MANDLLLCTTYRTFLSMRLVIQHLPGYAVLDISNADLYHFSVKKITLEYLAVRSPTKIVVLHRHILLQSY